MHRTLCQRLGFDEEVIAKRLSALDLGPEHHEVARVLQEQVLRPNLAQIVDTFYGRLTREPAFWQIVRTKSEIASLRRHQMQYLRTLGVDFDTEGYFETRLRVGMTHARVGVPLWLYHASFSTLLLTIRHHVPHGKKEPDCLDFLCRIVALDQGLATESYHEARIREATVELRSAEQREQVQRSRASRDSLTGFCRRDEVVETLLRAVERAHSHGQPISIVMADLDHFKQVNDTHGHLAGDGVLRAFAERVEGALRDADVVGRYGGEEFLFILDGTNIERAQEIAERVRARVAEEPFKAGKELVPITVSQGVAELAKDEEPLDLLSRADVALYRAKREGRDAVRIAAPPVMESG